MFSSNLSNRTLSGPWKVRWTPASSLKLKFITSTKSSTIGGLIISDHVMLNAFANINTFDCISRQNTVFLLNN